MEQWLVSIIYEETGSEPESEQCWCSARSEALEMAAALLSDYPDAHVEVQEGSNGVAERWIVDVCYREERECCAFLTADDAREFAEALAADYADNTSHSPAREITITGPQGWIDYVLGKDFALAG